MQRSTPVAVAAAHVAARVQKELHSLQAAAVAGVVSGRCHAHVRRIYILARLQQELHTAEVIACQIPLNQTPSKVSALEHFLTASPQMISGASIVGLFCLCSRSLLPL
jgi:hypothetical protein